MQKATERMQANTQPVNRYCIYNIIYIYGKKYSLAIYRTSYFSGNEKKTRKLFLLIPAVIWNNIRRKDKRKQDWKETKAEQIYRNTTNNNKTEEKKNKNISVSSLTNCRAAKKKTKQIKLKKSSWKTPRALIWRFKYTLNSSCGWGWKIRKAANVMKTYENKRWKK